MPVRDRLAGILRHDLARILVLAAALRVALVVTAFSVGNDGADYCWMAQKMAAEGVAAGMEGDFLFPFHAVNPRLPVYPLLGSLVYRATGNVELSLRLVSAVLGLGSVALAWVLARQLFEPPRVATLAAGLAAIHPVLVRSSAEVMRESTTGFLIISALVLLLLSLRLRKWWPLAAIAAGILLFAAFLTRIESGVALAVFCVLPLFKAGLSIRRKASVAACVLVAFCALEAPYWAWLAKRTGHPMMFNQAVIRAYEDPRETVTKKLVGDEG